ncbi:hypothetical protein J4476_01235 [Candidatus Woesearchaeota archaeon]|nr:MAG: hypothetical protein QT09_C0014G0064 [archaeon GW2011_AR18]MBS3161301.1 hypothetical protein [Candidatus Woesearchaeota archaeon]HIH25749.1 hypothetical protein [Nanoarchaeota archaeon]
MINNRLNEIRLGLAGILLSATLSCAGIYKTKVYAYNPQTQKMEECLLNVKYSKDHLCYAEVQKYQSEQRELCNDMCFKNPGMVGRCWP